VGRLSGQTAVRYSPEDLGPVSRHFPICGFTASDPGVRLAPSVDKRYATRGDLFPGCHFGPELPKLLGRITEFGLPSSAMIGFTAQIRFGVFWGLPEMKAPRLDPEGASVSDPGRCDRPVSN
jgi:hypothetical protein